jgi:hypothetical protein
MIEHHSKLTTSYAIYQFAGVVIMRAYSCGQQLEKGRFGLTGKKYSIYTILFS